MMRAPLDPEDYASRISAYVYGNILVLAALVALHDDTTTTTRAGLAVIGTALATFVAHVFAESVGRSARIGQTLTPREQLAELRDSVPILTSAVIPAVLVGLGALNVLELPLGLLLAEIWVVSRIAGIGFVITRLHGERPNTRTLAASATLTVVAVAVVVIKLILTH